MVSQMVECWAAWLAAPTVGQKADRMADLKVDHSVAMLVGLMAAWKVAKMVVMLGHWRVERLAAS